MYSLGRQLVELSENILQNLFTYGIACGAIRSITAKIVVVVVVVDVDVVLSSPNWRIRFLLEY